MEAALAKALEWLDHWRSGAAPLDEQRRRTMRRSSGRWRRCVAQSSSRWGGGDGGMAQDGRAAWCRTTRVA
jgi:hypothetical protein